MIYLKMERSFIYYSMNEFFLPVVRWTIGPVEEAGFDCLKRSIQSFTKLYQVQPIICHNGLTAEQLDYVSRIGVRIYAQNHSGHTVIPIGVAWKLYPIRLASSRHEIFIDNDLIIEKKIPEIDKFLASKQLTLLLEGETRNYGRFDRHVPPGFNINSGIFGVPPKYHPFYLDDHQWEENCDSTSRTWDEQGFVASSLLQSSHVIIPKTTIRNCEHDWKETSGSHFVGLNRVRRHFPYIEYKTNRMPFYL